MGCGGPEALIIFVVIAAIFGMGRLPQLGEGLGRAIRNFKRASSGENEIDVTPRAQLNDAETADEPDRGSDDRSA